MNRFHGIVSLILICISIGIGGVAIFYSSLFQAVIYGVITLIAFGCIVYFYCKKCPCRDDSCGHVLPGRLTALFPKRTSDKYSPLDFAATFIAMAIIVLFPQYWLWKHKLLFGVFWIFLIIGLLDILFFVCKECKNEYCPMCPNPKRIS